MSRRYTSSPPSASTACSGTALALDKITKTLSQDSRYLNVYSNLGPHENNSAFQTKNVTENTNELSMLIKEQ
jgi:hypothetical protein